MTGLGRVFAGEVPRRETLDGVFGADEVGLANRNHGAILETLASDITPVGAHYLLTHFDVPMIDPGAHRLRFSGAFENPFEMGMDEIRALPSVTMPVTLECAGNGRTGMRPRPHSMPWSYEAVGTSEWTGTPLLPLIERAGPEPGVADFAFLGADEGFDKGNRHVFGRSLTPGELAGLDVLLVWAMNGRPLPPQHGAPLRIVVPGWYGMASVKWLAGVEALTERYRGFQQVETYRFRQSPEEEGAPVNRIRVKSLMIPPGVPDWVSRARYVEPGPVTIRGRAWSGGGVPVRRVWLGDGTDWREAELDPPAGRYAWAAWRAVWEARPGEHVLRCRAEDAEGEIQPLEAGWNLGGFANNAAQRVPIFVPG